MLLMQIIPRCILVQIPVRDKDTIIPEANKFTDYEVRFELKESHGSGIAFIHVYYTQG